MSPAVAAVLNQSLNPKVASQAVLDSNLTGRTRPRTLHAKHEVQSLSLTGSTTVSVQGSEASPLLHQGRLEVEGSSAKVRTWGLGRMVGNLSMA